MTIFGHSLTEVLTGVVAIASVLSNFIPSYTFVGKVLHAHALNVKSGNHTTPDAGGTP